MKLLLLSISLLCSAIGHAVPWNLEDLKAAPSSQPSPEHDAGEVKAMFFEGRPWKGKPTKVFAYYGIPDVPQGQKVPAMVLVHGGGGSAFVPWVKLWMSRGYAAISMDTCGSISGGGNNNHQRHEAGGPPGWGGFDQVDEPLEDQWTYHAVSDIILAHSWIRSQAGVDPKRTGITGISWGGYLTCIVSGVDSRFKFAAPVYGCGFLGDNSTWLGKFTKMGPEKTAKWLKTWDPSVYLPRSKMPMLWVSGTNDFAYPMDSLQKSYRLPAGECFRSVRPRMPHGHGGAGENPEEIRVMADAVLKGGVPLMKVTLGKRDGTSVSASYRGKAKALSAVLHYTLDEGPWQKRNWQEGPAILEENGASAILPEGTKVYYFNVTDERGLISSSEHHTL
jgi:dienelactone hydrolase